MSGFVLRIYIYVSITALYLQNGECCFKAKCTFVNLQFIWELVPNNQQDKSQYYANWISLKEVKVANLALASVETVWET